MRLKREVDRLDEERTRNGEILKAKREFEERTCTAADRYLNMFGRGAMQTGTIMQPVTVPASMAGAIKPPQPPPTLMDYSAALAGGHSLLTHTPSPLLPIYPPPTSTVTPGSMTSIVVPSSVQASPTILHMLLLPLSRNRPVGHSLLTHTPSPLLPIYPPPTSTVTPGSMTSIVVPSSVQASPTILHPYQLRAPFTPVGPHVIVVAAEKQGAYLVKLGVSTSWPARPTPPR
ncbi:hypothetical protein ACOMHN_042353 [Nucella lapillus]